MEFIKTVLGGGVLKNVRLVIFLEPKTYLELINEAKHYKIVAKTDSQLIRAIIFKFINDMPMLTLEIESLKKALAKKNIALDAFMEKQKVKK